MHVASRIVDNADEILDKVVDDLVLLALGGELEGVIEEDVRLPLVEVGVYNLRTKK